MKLRAASKPFYFKDPDGHPLEILEFPTGKGNPKWHRETEDLFLGIDHTAIVVKDTEASLELYRDYLGLEVAGESENYRSRAGASEQRLWRPPSHYSAPSRRGAGDRVPRVSGASGRTSDAERHPLQ